MERDLAIGDACAATSPVGADASASRAALSGLTVELALYGALVAAALAVRLAGLGRAPMLAEELPTALAAWRMLQGEMPGAAGYVPLLFNAQLVLFVLGSGAMAARLLPALVGAALVGLPWLVREQLGRVGALAAAAFLAFSPSWVYAGRTADGAVLSVALGTLALAATWRFVDRGALGYARIVAVALAASLTAGAAVHTPLTAAALLAATWSRRAGAERRRLLSERLQAAARAHVPALFLLSFLGIASALWINPGGIGAVAELAGAWVGALSPGHSGLPWYRVPMVLALYEPLMVVLAAIGAYQGLRRRQLFETGALLWTAYALLLGLALGHREPGWMLGAVLPLTLLAARGVQALYDEWVPLTRQGWSLFLMALTVLGFSYLQLLYYVRIQHTSFLLFGGFGLGLLALSLIGYGLWIHPAAARRVALLLIGLVLSIPSIRGTAALGFDRARDPWEPFLHRPSAAALTELGPLLQSLSLQFTGDGRYVDILYEEGLGPQVAWAVREFPQARSTVRVGAEPDATVLITGPREPADRPRGYAGRPLALWETPAEGQQVQMLRWRWLLWREPGPPAQQELIWIWVRVQTDARS